MPITVEINEKQLKEQSLKMHFLPAKVAGEGPTSPDVYFNNYTRINKDGIMSNSLRGYPLLGQEMEVPNDYKGVVLQETREALSKNADRILRVTGAFDKFNYWNYDKIPSEGDNYRQAMQILNIYKALAEPISEEEVLAEMVEIGKRKIERASETNELETKVEVTT